MGKVVAIGGVFVRSPDPEALKAWYRDVLGMALEAWGGAVFPERAGGYGVWSAFGEDSTKFEPSRLPIMVNLVVDDLDAVLARVEAAGVAVLGREDQDAYGRFAWVVDPMGTKLELWQPAPEA